jgi:hypothetical protein
MPSFDTFVDGENITVEIDESDVIEYCRKFLYPKDIFTEEELDEWAAENNYIKEEENE